MTNEMESSYAGSYATVWIFGELARVRAFCRAVLAMLVTRRLEIEALILVLLIVSRAGVEVIALNSK